MYMNTFVPPCFFFGFIFVSNVFFLCLWRLSLWNLWGGVPQDMQLQRRHLWQGDRSLSPCLTTLRQNRQQSQDRATSRWKKQQQQVHSHSFLFQKFVLLVIPSGLVVAKCLTKKNKPCGLSNCTWINGLFSLVLSGGEVGSGEVSEAQHRGQHTDRSTAPKRLNPRWQVPTRLNLFRVNVALTYKWSERYILLW